MFIEQDKASDKICPIMTTPNGLRRCYGIDCAFWRTSHMSIDQNGTETAWGLCGAAPVAPHRDLLRKK